MDLDRVGVDISERELDTLLDILRDCEEDLLLDLLRDALADELRVCDADTLNDLDCDKDCVILRDTDLVNDLLAASERLDVMLADKLRV